MHCLFRSFKKGAFIVEYAGELIDWTEAKQREEEYSKDSSVGCYMYYFVYNNTNYWYKQYIYYNVGSVCMILSYISVLMQLPSQEGLGAYSIIAEKTPTAKPNWYRCQE